MRYTSFIIAGKPNCPFFAQAIHVADFLNDRLPNFKVHKMIKNPEEWNEWLLQINLQNGWYHEKSPIIWKELIMRGGKPYLIGSLSEFWEYCYDYYGLDYILPKVEVKKLVKDNMQFFKRNQLYEKSLIEKIIVICIYGDNLKLVYNLASEIINAKIFTTEEVTIKIYGNEVGEIDNFEPIMLEPKTKVNIENYLSDAIKDADLLILTNDYSRLPNENFYEWLHRNKDAMVDLADTVNFYAKKSLRIIVATDGPVCFNATILTEVITSIHIHNIVALTCDEGLRVVNAISKKLNVPVNELNAPPVWGFIGINQIIDIDHIVQKYNIYRPNIRATKNDFGTTLSLGRKHKELRFMNYLTHDAENIWTTVEQQKIEAQQIFAHQTFLPKIRAIVSLLKCWYKNMDKKNIISLGILSKGHNGIPVGIVFSQPVIYENKRWIPYTSFPAPNTHHCTVTDLVPFTVDILSYFKVWKSRSSIKYKN